MHRGQVEGSVTVPVELKLLGHGLPDIPLYQQGQDVVTAVIAGFWIK